MKDFLLVNIRKFKKKILFILVLKIIVSVIFALLPALNGMYIDYLTLNPSKTGVIYFSIIIIIIGLIGTALDYVYRVYNSKAEFKLSFEFYSHLTNYVQKIPFVEINKFSLTYMNQRIMNDSSDVAKFIFSKVITTITASLQLLIILILFGQANLNIFFIAMSFMPIYIILYLKLKKPLFNESLQHKETQNNYFTETNDYYNTFKELKYHSNLGIENSSIKTKFSEYKIVFMNFVKINFLFQSVDSILGMIFQSIILIIGGINVVNMEISLGEFAVINVYFSILLAAIKHFVLFGQTYQDTKSSLDRIDEIYKIKQEANGIIRLDNITNIEIKDLEFYYDRQLIFKNLNLHFMSGNIYALVGKNGAGKTTLMSLVLGLMLPNHGSIKYNNNFISKLDLYDLRKNNISVMVQNEEITNRTVKGFLLNSRESLSEYLVRIQESVFSDIFLSRDFDIRNYFKENLIDLSGGEQQLIILLRTFMKESSVYILDEPTSQLNSRITEKVINCLQKIKKNTIIVIISHDKKLINESDTIINI